MPAPHRLLRLLALLFAVTLLGAACGDDDDSADDPTVQDDGGEDGASDAAADDGGEDEVDSSIPDPCTFLTLEDLETLFGSPFEAGTPTDSTEGFGQRQCTWGGVEGITAKVVSISVGTEDAQLEVFPIGGAELFEQTRSAFADSIDEEDAGLGDDSFRAGSSIYVLDGDTTYTFMVTGSSDEALAGLKAMAEKVVDEQG
jgi:hypothetical protein